MSDVKTYSINFNCIISFNDVTYRTVTGPAAGRMCYEVNLASARVTGDIVVS